LHARIRVLPWFGSHVQKNNTKSKSENVFSHLTNFLASSSDVVSGPTTVLLLSMHADK